MTVPFFAPYFPPEMRERVLAALDEVMASGTLMMGPWKDRFEASFREITGCTHAISLNSATTALQISLQYFDVRDAEVLVPAASFLTDVSSVLMSGGTPVLVDANPETLSFDLADMERKLTARTKGIIWVHLAGLIGQEYEAIVAFARKHGLFLIEDAAHAHGATIDGRSAGSLGDVGIFSFYPTKLVTSGTGGMLTTDDPDLARYATEMRMFGKDASGEIVRIGNDWFLDEFRACIGFHQVDDLGRQLRRRRQIAARYTERLANQPGIRLLDIPKDHEPSWYHFPAFLTDDVDHDALTRRLREGHGIHTKRIYRPTHHEQVFRYLDDGTLTRAETMLERSFCLPMYVGLTDEAVVRVGDAVIAELRRAE